MWCCSFRIVFGPCFSPSMHIFFCKFTFPLVNFHLSIYQTREKKFCIRTISKSRIVLRYHICREWMKIVYCFPPFPHHSPTEKTVRKVYQWVDEWKILKAWLDLWKIGFCCNIRKDWAYICMTICCFVLSICFLFFIFFIFFMNSMFYLVVEFLFRSVWRKLSIYTFIFERQFRTYAWEALNRPKIQLWNGFTSIHQNENWLLDGCRVESSSTHNVVKLYAFPIYSILPI